MEDTKSGGVSRGDSGEFGGEDESSKPPHGIRWIAPVDPVTGEADTRLCFLYADMWRRLLDPGEDDLENFVVAGATGGLGVRGYGRTVAPEVYDAMLSSILSVVKRLDLRYETSDEGGRWAVWCFLLLLLLCILVECVCDHCLVVSVVKDESR